MQTLRGRVVLLVDDDLGEAQKIMQFLRLRGASVLGPVPSVLFALDIIQTERTINYALVDRTLQGSDTYAVADALLQRQIAFLWLNGAGQDATSLPPQYRHVPSHAKPLSLPDLAEALHMSLERPATRTPAGIAANYR